VNHDTGAISRWSDVDFAALHPICSDVKERAEKAFRSPATLETRQLHDDVARILLTRLRDPFVESQHGAWSPEASFVVSIYGEAWSHAMAERYAPEEPVLAGDVERFCELIRNTAIGARCSSNHPLFDFAARKASRSQLTELLNAENLCDLNFVHFVTLLILGATGEPAAELAANLWDEFGRGDPSKFHREARLEMMQNIGALNGTYPSMRPEDYMVEEVEHFNAYALSGTLRSCSLRAIGMMFATEFLVPQQLEAIIAGWRRNGLPDKQMKYLIDHHEGDVEHANGWAERVVLPLVRRVPSARAEIHIGARQHVEILGRLYDRIASSWGLETSG
jgi:pyrroloquinoline quinone (PQQ) biosynthesis protein C